MLAMVCLLTLAAADLTPEDEPRRVTVWTAPVAGTFGLALFAYSATNHNPRPTLLTAFPVGFIFKQSDDLGIAAEAALVAYPTSLPGSDFIGSDTAWGVLLSAGIARSRLGRTGFFFEPKASVELFPPAYGNRGMASCLLGLDAGYELSFSVLYLALVVGVSAGVGINRDSLLAGIPLNAVVGRTIGPIIGLNPNLLRLGVRL